MSLRAIACLGTIVGYEAAAWQFHGALLIIANDALRVGVLCGLALWIGIAGVARFLAIEVAEPISKVARADPEKPDETRHAA